MKIAYIFSGIVLTAFSAMTASAQDEVGGILTCIEQNNRELSALRSRIEADKYGYKAEKALEDPEFGFDYLWGNPDQGNRKDFSITQTLDLSLLFVSKGKLSNTSAYCWRPINYASKSSTAMHLTGNLEGISPRPIR